MYVPAKSKKFRLGDNSKSRTQDRSLKFAIKNRSKFRLWNQVRKRKSKLVSRAKYLSRAFWQRNRRPASTAPTRRRCCIRTAHTESPRRATARGECWPNLGAAGDNSGDCGDNFASEAILARRENREKIVVARAEPIGQSTCLPLSETSKSRSSELSTGYPQAFPWIGVW